MPSLSADQREPDVDVCHTSRTDQREHVLADDIAKLRVMDTRSQFATDMIAVLEQLLARVEALEARTQSQPSR